MVIQDLKQKIENGYKDDSLIILKYSDTDFVATQYYRKIAQDRCLPIEVIEDLSVVLDDTFDMFGITETSLRIYRTDKFENSGYRDIKNLIIITKAIDKKIQSEYINYIVEIPKLENWQIKDYAYSNLEGLTQKEMNWLIDSCNDIYRIDNEISRLKVFNTQDRGSMFKQGFNDGIYDDLTQHTIFNLTNAIIKRDKQSIISVYKELYKLDSSEMGVLAILYQAFKNVLNIQLSSNATAESCGLKPNQFWAIKKNNIGYYTNDEIVKIFSLLSDIDRRIKVGEMPMNNLLDYLLVTIIGG